MKSEITIVKRLTRAWMAWLAVTVLLFAATPGYAHGGFDHAGGTVVKVTNHVLTLKTVNGNIDVTLNDKTDLFKNGRKAGMADLVPGARVVVDITEGGKGMLAHSVKIGLSGKTVTQVAKGADK
jgi:cold shock CspA family protein